MCQRIPAVKVLAVLLAQLCVERVDCDVYRAPIRFETQNLAHHVCERERGRREGGKGREGEREREVGRVRER
jgi:hypothetical protein